MRFITLLMSFVFFVSLYATELQKAQLYTNQNIDGWYMSEKLDGIRGYWDGKQLYTRQMKPIHAPKWFTKDLPPFALDGELWTTRDDFENIQSIVMREIPNERWKKIKYMIFEAPNSEGDFLERLKRIEKYLTKTPLLHVEIIEQKECKNKETLEIFLRHVIENKGEGIMIKNSALAYEGGRVSHILKVKKFQDIEATIIGYKEGKGKYKGMLGSLHVEMKNSTRFYIGGGLSDELRKNPPKIGTIITFKYYGYTKNGKPKFASYLRVRED